MLRAAINFNRAEGGCDRIVSVTLPDRCSTRTLAYPQRSGRTDLARLALP